MASIRPDGSPLPRPQLDTMQLSLGPLYRLFQTADGWLCLAAITEEHWSALAEALGHPEWVTDPRFRTAEWRLRHRVELEELLEEQFRTMDSASGFALLDSVGVPCEIPNPDFGLTVFDDADMATLGLTTRLHHPKLGRYESFGRTIDFSDTQPQIWGAPPLCGQHTCSIMREMGYEDAEIEKLVAARAVFEELWVD
jgi:crotonobetainyl-CoA:carnitine CoA-transferase CaiB-like acyl-CoA transferase